MTSTEWKKVARHCKQGETCPVCKKSIAAEAPYGVTYSKTRSGGHVFIHDKCVVKWS